MTKRQTNALPLLWATVLLPQIAALRIFGRLPGKSGRTVAHSGSRCVLTELFQLKWARAVSGFAVLSALNWAAPAVADALPETTIQIGGYAIRVEVADTPASRTRGLMRRKNLAENQGMLFVFDEAAAHSIWMKDTPLPLAVAFIDASGRILNIAEMKPFSLDNHTADGDALYALEVNRGWFSRRGIKAGDKVERLEIHVK
ncbi:MAG: DUF192 domain-containing protein [Burkholderiales bacterium]|nr:DUF192 domain-containing protein [Burkholderiales bacterium]